MASDLEIKAVVEAILKDHGLKSGAEGLKKTADAANQAKREVNSLDSQMASFGRTLVSVFSIGALTQFARTSVLEFARIERALNSLGIEMENLGIGSRADLPAIRAYLEAIRDAGGPMLGESLRTFQRLIGITKEVNTALTLTGLAANVSEKGLLSVESAGEQLANILQGRAAMAAKALGIELRNADGSLKSNADLLRAVAVQYGGMADKLNDTTDALDKQAATWEEIKQRVGSALTPVVYGLTVAFQFLVGAVGKFGQAAGDAFSVAILSVREFIKVVDQITDKAGLFADPEAYFRKIGDAAKNALTSVASAVSDAAKNLLTPPDLDPKKDAGNVNVAAGIEAAAKIAARAQADGDAKAAAEQAERDAKAATEKQERLVAFEQQTQEAILRAQIDATEEGTQERLAAELAYLAELREASVREAELLGADVAMVRDLFRLMETEARDEHRRGLKEQAAEDQKEFFERLKEQVAAENNATAAKIRLAKFERDQKRQAALSIADAAVGALRAVFGESKLVAIAETVVNTAQGVMQALGTIPPPYSFVVAGLIAATGAAQLAKIKSTEPGSGASVDSPSGSPPPPQAVVQASVRTPGGDVPSNLEQQGGQSSGLTIVINGMYGGREGIRELVRELDSSRAGSNSRRPR